MTDAEPTPPDQPALKPLVLQLNPLRDALREFREVMFAIRREASIGLKEFPAGACADASLLLAEYFRQRGVDAWTLGVVDVQDGRTFSHVWVQAGPYHMDITGDQFEGEPAVFIGKLLPPIIGARVPKRRSELGQLDRFTQATLQRDMALIQAALARRQTDARYWPRREVRDRWRDMDVLICGHFRYVKGISRARSRRCPDCPPTTPASVFRAIAEDVVLDWFGSLSDEGRGDVLARAFADRGELAQRQENADPT